jgi:hypothetical protein
MVSGIGLCGCPEQLRSPLFFFNCLNEQAYKSLVRPSLEYTCSVWDQYTKENRYSVGLLGMLLIAIITPLALVT